MGTWVMQYFDKLTFTNLIWDKMDPKIVEFFGWCIILVMAVHWLSELYSYVKNYTNNKEYKVYGFIFSLFVPYLLMVVALQISLFGILAAAIYVIACFINSADKHSAWNRIKWTRINGEDITGHLTTFNIMYSLRCYCLKKDRRAEYIDKLEKEQQEYLAKYSHITI